MEIIRDLHTVRIFLRSEWAKVGVVTLPYYDDIVRAIHQIEGPDVADSPVYTMRESVTNLVTQIQVDDGAGTGRVWPMDTIYIQVRGP